MRVLVRGVGSARREFTRRHGRTAVRLTAVLLLGGSAGFGDYAT